ncbi:sulfonate transport system substrate-binding protein [Paenibacillus sp. DS2015]|uniref:aliphatic sulfonate ABC transporter substrate-binding protein n=1 Tax=Paenibacillus sp. DS2015 TaxID=3373917 RepID=UPI003D1D4AEA
MNQKRKFILFILVVSMMLLSACGSTSEAGSGKSEASSFTINIANMGLPILNVAKEKGWFEEEFTKLGATVAWSNHPAGPPINEGIASKRIDLAVLGEGAVLSGAANNIDVKLISLLSDGVNGVNYLIAPKGSEIKTAIDLKGKQIGVSLGTSHHVFLLKLLDSVGLQQSDVKIVNLTIMDAQPAFQTGQLDAWITADPFADIEVKTNGAILISSGESLNITSPTFYITRGEFAKEHPEAVKVFLQVIEKANQFAKEHHEEFIDLAAKSSGRDRSQVETSASKAEYQSSPTPDEILKELQSSADILTDLKYLTKKIDVKEIVDNTFITGLKK